MKLEVDIPDELFEKHFDEDTDDEDAILDALSASLASSQQDTDRITARKLKHPHARPVETWTYDSWEEGQPCPDCGHTTVRVHFVDVIEYTSENGEFEYENYTPEPGDAPEIFWQCSRCYARLQDSIPGTFFY